MLCKVFIAQAVVIVYLGIKEFATRGNQGLTSPVSPLGDPVTDKLSFRCREKMCESWTLKLENERSHHVKVIYGNVRRNIILTYHDAYLGSSPVNMFTP